MDKWMHGSREQWPEQKIQDIQVHREIQYMIKEAAQINSEKSDFLIIGAGITGKPHSKR